MRASLRRQDGHEWVGVWRLDAPVVFAEMIEDGGVVLRIVIEDGNAPLQCHDEPAVDLCFRADKLTGSGCIWAGTGDHNGAVWLRAYAEHRHLT